MKTQKVKSIGGSVGQRIFRTMPVIILFFLAAAFSAFFMPGCEGKVCYAEPSMEIGQEYYKDVTIESKGGEENGKRATILFIKQDDSCAYGVKLGKLYVQTGAKTAQLLGDYEETVEIVRIADQNLQILRVLWGDNETHYYINGVKHVVGKNGSCTVYNGELVLCDESSSNCKRINAQGALLGNKAKDSLKNK